MAHDVFISHASQDKAIADNACASLEAHGIRCWIAPRDVQPGRSFAGEITRAIEASKAMVLIFSAHTKISDQTDNGHCHRRNCSRGRPRNRRNLVFESSASVDR